MKKVTYTLAGVIIGATLTASSPALAGAVKSISASINDSVSVVINGQKATLDHQPINYNNLNYIPIGDISRALNLNIQYDKTSNTIQINNKEDTKVMSETSTTNQTNNSSVYQATQELPSAPPIENSPAASTNELGVYSIGDTVSLDGATFKVTNIEQKDFDEERKQILIHFEAKVTKEPKTSNEVSYINFVKGFVVDGLMNSETFGFDTGTESKIMSINETKTGTLIKTVKKTSTVDSVTISNPLDFYSGEEAIIKLH